MGGWPRVQPRTDLTRLQVLLSWTWESPLQAFRLPLWSPPPRLALLGHRRISLGESTSALSFDHHPLASGVHTLSGAGTQKPHITRDSVLPLSSPPGMVAPSCTSHNLEPPGANRIPPSEPPARRVGGGLWDGLNAHMACSFDHKVYRSGQVPPPIPRGSQQFPAENRTAGPHPAASGQSQDALLSWFPFLRLERLLPEPNFVLLLPTHVFFFLFPVFPASCPHSLHRVGLGWCVC